MCFVIGHMSIWKIYIYILRIHVRLGSRVCLTDGCTCDFARFNSLMIMNNTERNTFLVRLGLSLPTAAHVSLRSSPFQPRSGNGDCRRRRSRQGRSRRSGRCTGYRTLFLEEATPCIAGASYTLVKHGHSVDNRQEKVRHTFLFLDVTHCLCVILMVAVRARPVTAEVSAVTAT